jgi:hypothetical protein
MQTQNQNEFIQTLLECAFACEHCAASCLHEDDVKMMVRCIALDRDCADICTQAARLLQRNSEITREYLQVCEQICRMCSEECSKHQHMEHCRMCSEACLRCAEACSSMYSMSGRG